MRRGSFLLAVLFSVSVSWAGNQPTPKEPLNDAGVTSDAAKELILKEWFYRESVKGVRQVSEPTVKNWFTRGPADGVEGTRTDSAYLAGIKTGVEPVIVAVIDSGVDIFHEDLKGKIWINRGEVGEDWVDSNGNGIADEVKPDGIDNDGNGYVDDFHGWNFLGGYDSAGNPKHINQSQLEVTREVIRLTALSKSRSLNTDEKLYLKLVKREVSESLKRSRSSEADAKYLRGRLKKTRAALSTVIKKPFSEWTTKLVGSIQSTNSSVMRAKRRFLSDCKLYGLSGVNHLDRIIEYNVNAQKYYYNLSFNPRPEIVGDDYSNLSEKGYGNWDVRGPEGHHGTHVAGIIAAVRGNRIGIDGIATDVLIMPVRAVPDGDETDKDVANAIRYAVDNGARIINMSFGKSYSPQKSEVDRAAAYAESRGVLLVHAAGNDSQNNDQNSSFPNPRLPLGSKVESWIEVAASTWQKGVNLPADFTNWGRKTVDIFAPGESINSTIPDNKYESLGGTSMASPVVAGIAALVLSQFPGINGKQLKEILMMAVRKYPNMKVNVPTNSRYSFRALFSSLSVSMGITDAVHAIGVANILHPKLRVSEGLD